MIATSYDRLLNCPIPDHLFGLLANPGLGGGTYEEK